jgi:hypothetical protein
MMTSMKPRTPRTPTARPTSDALTAVVRDKLLALGDFAHLHVRRDREDVIVEQPGPPDDPDEREPVLRLTPIGGFRFGLSRARDDGRWEKMPVSGVLAEVLAQAVDMLGPWLARETLIGDTSGTVY